MPKISRNKGSYLLTTFFFHCRNQITDRSFCTYPKLSEKLKFVIVCYAHVNVYTMGKQMLVFQKVLRTYKINGTLMCTPVCFTYCNLVLKSRQVLKDFRSSRPEVFCKKGILKNFAKLTGEHLCWESLFQYSCRRPAILQSICERMFFGFSGR